ncbi:MAG: TonB-dependent receptor [Pseudomonadota bacterium]
MRGFQPKTLAKAVSAAVVAGAIATPAAAQTLEEVIVTATKREQSVQDVPLSITALSGDFMQQANLNDVKDLIQYTPGVTGNSQDSFIDAVSVRGIRTQDFGIGLEPSIAFFKNDLYEGRNGSVVSSIFDLDRAEILRGPQGFLFGRNAIGGAFSVYTRRAGQERDAYFQIDAGERGYLVLDGGINTPINDNFSMRFSGYHAQEDGFAENFFDGDDLGEYDKYALRWSTSFETERLGIYTFVEYEDRESYGSLYRAVEEGEVWDALEAALGPIELRGSDEDLDSDISAGETDESELLSIGIRIDYDLDFATLTSNTGYKDHEFFYSEDYDGTPLTLENYQQDQEGDYFQQELRLTSNTDGALSWYAGLSYYREELDTGYAFEVDEDLICSYYNYAYYGTGLGCSDYIGPDFTPSPDGLLTETGFFTGKYTGWGTYVNLAWQITDSWAIEGGVRYTEDEKEFTVNVPNPESDLGAFWGFGFSTDGTIKDTETWDDWTPRLILRWTPNDTAMVYASYTEGFKAGGYGTFTLSPSAVGETDIPPNGRFRPDTVDPEIVDSYELGYKDTFLDGNMNMDIVAFYYEYTDAQVTAASGGGPTQIRNAGEIDGQGIEASFTAGLGDYFTAYLAVSYLDSEANEIQDLCGLGDPNGCEGSRIFWAPEWTAAFVLDGYFPLSGGAITGAYELSYEDERGGGWEGLPETFIDSYAEMNFRVGYESDDNWFVQAYVENFTDEFTWDGQNNNGGKTPSHFFGPKRPRTVGVRIGANWD